MIERPARRGQLDLLVRSTNAVVERLLAAICTGTAGAVLAIEASRLARNGRDWHTLLDFCAVVNTLLVDKW